MTTNPINDEILRIKRELAARFDNDLEKIVVDIKSRERNTITLPARIYAAQSVASTNRQQEKVRFLSSPLKNPGFPRVFRILGQLPWLSCLSMHVHACRCCPWGNHRLVRCLGLQKHFRESSSESPESSKNLFSRENMLFCSGGAGFELGEY